MLGILMIAVLAIILGGLLVVFSRREDEKRLASLLERGLTIPAKEVKNSSKYIKIIKINFGGERELWAVEDEEPELDTRKRIIRNGKRILLEKNGGSLADQLGVVADKIEFLGFRIRR